MVDGKIEELEILPPINNQPTAINLFNPKKDIAILHRGAVFGDDGADGTGAFGLDFVHDFHCLDDAKRLADRNGRSNLNEIRRVRSRFLIERADHRGVDFSTLGGRGGWRWGRTTGRSGGGHRSGGGGGRKAGEQAAEVVEIGAFFQLQVKIFFAEVEQGEPVLVHEFDDFADFRKVHCRDGLGLVLEPVRRESSRTVMLGDGGKKRQAGTRVERSRAPTLGIAA